MNKLSLGSVPRVRRRDSPDKPPLPFVQLPIRLCQIEKHVPKRQVKPALVIEDVVTTMARGPSYTKSFRPKSWNLRPYACHWEQMRRARD
jgi:hypothetical protein